MTRDEMIEKLAKAINGPHNPVPSNSEHTLSDLRDVRWAHLSKNEKQVCINAAAAVLDLCGPKPLEWHRGSAVSSNGTRYLVARTDFDDGCGEFWYIYINDKPAGKLGQHNSDEAAQAAAQAHADAAHWANTPMGDL